MNAWLQLQPIGVHMCSTKACRSMNYHIMCMLV